MYFVTVIGSLKKVRKSSLVVWSPGKNLSFRSSPISDQAMKHGDIRKTSNSGHPFSGQITDTQHDSDHRFSRRKRAHVPGPR